MSSGPNPVSVGFSVVRSLMSTRPPGPFGNDTADHSLLESPLSRLKAGGPAVVSDLGSALTAYLEDAGAVSPTSLTSRDALAYWINLYNAGALLLAGRAQRDGEDSILRIPGGFRQTVIAVQGESLSLDNLEHGKLRRFGDPRIHAALVCGSVSCPTLRGEPYRGAVLDDQLDDQLRYFLASGALQPDTSRGVAYLSRVFLWFGGDFVRPKRMPTFLPSRSKRVLRSLRPWMDAATDKWVDNADPEVEFQRYDWGLSCSVR